MSKLKRLKEAESLSELARLLGYKKPKIVSYILYKIPQDAKYHSFDIPKKQYGFREIQAPTEQLKDLQRRLAKLLQDCLDEIESGKGKKTQLAHGFRRGFSIVTNAKKHRKKRYVLNLDLEDFFPSINFGRVRGFFIKNKHFALNDKVATVIAQIACHENTLPQGSPSSPVISNLIAHILDAYLVQLAKKHNCTYSRYADDITFSSNLKQFPAEIAVETDNRNIMQRFLGQKKTTTWSLGEPLIAQIQAAGFNVNHGKTRMQFKNSRQVATGLVVNNKVNVKREFYLTVRSQCNELFRTGTFYRKVTIDGEEFEEPGTLRQLEGALSFIYHVRKPKAPLRQIMVDKKGEPLTKKHIYEHGPSFERAEAAKDGRKPERGLLKLYRNFLAFKYFHGLEQPLIICEGKTDNVYLGCALNQLVDKFPNLAEMQINPKTGKNEVIYNLQLFRNHGAVREIWNHASGTSFLATIIRKYEEFLKPFKCDGQKHPVILIVDNDDGPRKGGGVYQQAAKVSGQKNIDGSNPFYHVAHNLFVVPLPKTPNGKDIDFEGLFDDATRKRKYRKKVFKRQPKDLKKEYGKSIFADHVIRLNQQKISFAGFEPLLQVIDGIINSYTPPS